MGADVLLCLLSNRPPLVLFMLVLLLLSTIHIRMAVQIKPPRVENTMSRNQIDRNSYSNGKVLLKSIIRWLRKSLLRHAAQYSCSQDLRLDSEDTLFH